MMQGKRLYRSQTSRMLCGVCGGLGDYFNIDPTLIRLLVAILTLFSCFTGVIAYIIAAIIIPEEGSAQ